MTPEFLLKNVDYWQMRAMTFILWSQMTLGHEEKEDITIHDIGRPNGKSQRMLSFSQKLLKKAIEIDADIYHFYDSELMPSGIKLKKCGKAVVYDSHEDLPRQLMSRLH